MQDLFFIHIHSLLERIYLTLVPYDLKRENSLHSRKKNHFLSSLDGRPVYIVKIGSMDFKGLLKTVGEVGFIKQVSMV